MTITTESRFTRVRISVSSESFCGWDGISVTLDTDPVTYMSWAVSELGVPRDGDFTLLAVMGEILDADGNFRDADGNTVEIDVGSAYGITTFEDFINAGYPNPFKDYPDAWYRRGIIGQDAGENSTRSVNANGQVSHVERMSKIPGLESPSGDNMTVSMTEWTTRLYINNRWQIVFDYVEEDGVTINNRHEKVEWKALLAMLEGMRISGPEVPQDLDTTDSSYNALNPLDGAVFQFTPEGGTAQTFTVGGFSWTLAGAEDWITELICDVTAGSGSTYDQASYAGYIQTRTVTIGSINNSLIPVWGAYEVPLRAKSIDFANGQALVVRDDLMYARTRDGREVPILGGGLSIDTSELDSFTGTEADWWMAVPPVLSVHHTAQTGGDKTIRIRNPIDTLRAGVIITQSIHNRQPTQHGPKIHVQDWDGNLLFTLRPTQRAEYKISHGTDGVGELIVTELPVREHFRGGAAIGNLGVNKIDWSTTHWAIPLPTGGDGVTDADAIQLGSVVYVDEVAWSSINHERMTGSIIPTHGGQISIDLEMELAAPITGLIDAGWETELRGYRGSNAYVVGGTNRQQQSYGGIGQRRLIHVQWRGICRGGDIYTPLMRWAKSSTMNLSNVTIQNYQLAVEIRPLIEADTT